MSKNQSENQDEPQAIPDPGGTENITDGLSIVSYCVDTEGCQRPQSAEIWNPANIVNQQAWQEIERKISRIKERIMAGKVSCLQYYMVVNHMDRGLLAQYTQQSRFWVYLHTLPCVFNRLGQKTLQKYAEVFHVTEEDLRQGKLLPPVYETNVYSPPNTNTYIPGEHDDQH